ncbi:MAG: glycosyltransferase 87 family protein [Pseudomonadota bacterium]
MTARSKNSFAFSAAASASALLYVYLAIVSRTYADATLIDAAVVYGGALLAVAALALATRPDAEIDWPLLFGWAVVLRLLAFATYPVLEDDFFRYLWDGAQTLAVGTPYGMAPADAFDVVARDAAADPAAAVLDGINHPELPTVYGPTLQLLFAGSNVLAPWALWPLKLAALLADLAVLRLLWLLAPGRACWWWALCPLLLKEFATTAHPDVLGAACLVIGLWAYDRGRPAALGVSVGLALGIKPFALLFAPFLLLRRPRAWPWCLATLLGLTLCFAPASSPVAVWLPGGLEAMAQGWTFNAPLHRLGAWLGLPATLTARGLLTAYAAIWAAALWRQWREPERQPVPALLWLMGLFWLVTPVLNPWYLVWWLPLAVLRPAATPWIAAAAVLLSYGAPINTGEFPLQAPAEYLYAVPGWLLVAQLALVGVGLWLDRRRARYSPPAVRSSL